MPFRPATGRQKEAVRQVLPPEDWDKVDSLSFGNAVRVIGHDPERWRKFKPTPLQKKILREYGLYKSGMTCGDAWDLIADIKAELLNTEDFVPGL